MVTAIVEDSAIIPAKPAEVYALMADYRVGHLSVLPKQFFTDMRVVEGGYGEGTVIDVDMKALGVVRQLRMKVTEPEKGHILKEVDVNTGTETAFIFEPVAAGTRLTISSKFNFGKGFTGFMEKLINPPIAHDIYKKELQNIVAHFETLAMN